ncbi:hypothetical protein [Streptomyces sp. NPDC020141]|uniref:hypothetical protein n=1 Tax=Streptomyces sp. NPDC020141 TaxID=3365065 RepID=UPI0037989E49
MIRLWHQAAQGLQPRLPARFAGDGEKAWRGTAGQSEVVAAATEAAPENRFPSVRSLARARYASG